MIHLKKYNDFLNEMFDGKTLTYYSFDVDDNLLFNSTVIHMDKKEGENWIPVDVSTEEFAVVRNDKENYRYRNNEPNEAFSDFRDWGPRGNDTFLLDFQDSVINKRFGPSWNKFIECMVNGYIFSIITSRGHSIRNVQRAIEWLIYEYGLDNFQNLDIKGVDNTESLEDQMITNLLSYHELFGEEPEQVIDEYLKVCPIYCISSEEFIKKFGKLDANEAKKVALRDFTKQVDEYAKKIGCNAKLGFSDDDPKFVSSAIDEFANLLNDYKNIDFTVFDTGGKGMKKIEL